MVRVAGVAPGGVIALGAGGACLWSVPGAVSGQGSVGCCQLITKLGRAHS